jgi:DNA-binding LytR/AlgR family response regulator
MKILNCVVVDDEPLAADGLAELLAEQKGVASVKKYYSIDELLHFYEQEDIDVIFLDIQMPGKNGVDFVRNFKLYPLIVFVTAYRDYAVEGFELQVTDYLLKPVSPERLQSCLAKIQDSMVRKRVSAASIQVKSNGSEYLVPINEILFVESMENYVKVFVLSGTCFTVLSTLKKMESLLIPQGMVKCHKSYIINPQYVESFRSNRLEIKGVKVPVSRKYKHELDFLLKQYWSLVTV